MVVFSVAVVSMGISVIVAIFYLSFLLLVDNLAMFFIHVVAECACNAYLQIRNFLFTLNFLLNSGLMTYI